jgi:hypothetical protein
VQQQGQNESSAKQESQETKKALKKKTDKEKKSTVSHEQLSDNEQQRQLDKQTEEAPEIDQEKTDQESVRSDLLNVLSGVQSQKEGAERFSNAQARANEALDKIQSLEKEYKEIRRKQEEEWTPPEWTSDLQAGYSKRIKNQNESWKGWTRLSGKPSTFLDQILKKEFDKHKKYYREI